eukprot:Protomagalhaensia_wolfi_Nauph_80__2073@NODE_2326_length_1127_cov_8_031250_g1821_i0_p1_GENE_NODE_2326_length_1127_cov_8_031250_g1821_i0NODE_2326_length_1127_cov_8_031250_g1821_i0_p1_ORF_typecomplete_len322_score91_02Chromo/PF00385_24/3_8e15_NODE_2326_length_1127_cov_8_031250_g1821_i01281093
MKDAKRRLSSKRAAATSGFDSNDDQVYIVESILDSRVIDGQEEYHVKWKGYSLNESTWEPKANIEPTLIAKFKKSEARKRKAPVSAGNSPKTRRVSRKTAAVRMHETVSIEDDSDIEVTTETATTPAAPPPNTETQSKVVVEQSQVDEVPSLQCSPAPVLLEEEEEGVEEIVVEEKPQEESHTLLPPPHVPSAQKETDMVEDQQPEILEEEITTRVPTMAPPSPSRDSEDLEESSTTHQETTGAVFGGGGGGEESQWKVLHLGHPPIKGAPGLWALLARQDGIQQYLHIDSVRKHFPNCLFDYLLSRVKFERSEEDQPSVI